jgi:hypothetical protein
MVEDIIVVGENPFSTGLRSGDLDGTGTSVMFSGTPSFAERGTRPFALKDQRTASAYIFGAICPALGRAAGLVLPSCNTEAMTLHLQEIAVAVAPGAHAVLFVDRACLL